MDLIKKLRLNIDRPLWLINAPVDCQPLFADFEIKEKTTGKNAVSQLVLFVRDSKELNHQVSILSAYISDDTVFWICYPKQSGALSSDLIRMETWDVVFQMGFRGQTSVSVNDDWSGFRTTKAPNKKPSMYDVPMEERKAEGIDFVNRTAQLPADALALVKKQEGMLDFFNAMSFTHKKEYVLSIVEAKQAETRKRRIEKMIEMLAKKMSEKGIKKK